MFLKINTMNCGYAYCEIKSVSVIPTMSSALISFSLNDEVLAISLNEENFMSLMSRLDMSKPVLDLTDIPYSPSMRLVDVYGKPIEFRY